MNVAFAIHNLRRRRLVNLAVCRRIIRRRRNRPNRRRYWHLPRPQNSWFEIHYNDPALPDDYFKQQLRVRKQTFQFILNIIAPDITRQNTRFQDCIKPEKVLAIGLYRLAHGNSYVTIGPALNVGKSTVVEAVQDVVNALFDLRNVYIKFPRTAAETASTIDTFRDNTKSELVNVAGAIDGTHITIVAPKENAVDYFSRYQQHDIIVQGVVDGRGKFIDAVVGFPGSAHDARVLRNSDIYVEAEAGAILQEPRINIGGREIRPYLVGDSAYPQAPWLIKPFPEATRVNEEITFNKELSTARVVVERAFGILKSRWRVLSKRLDSNLKFTIKTTIACIVLHNICLELNDDWDDDGDNRDPPDNQNNAGILQDGDQIRDLLKDFVCGNV